MRKIDRFLEYIDSKGITENRATVECGLSNGLIGQAKRGKSDLGDRAVVKILNQYRDLSKVWLLTGEGQMLKSVKNEMPQSDSAGLADLLLAIQQHGAQLMQHGEELKRQGERLDRVLDLVSKCETGALAFVSQSRSQNSPPILWT